LNPSLDDHLRETLRTAFGSRPTLRLTEAAKVLNINEKLLRHFARRNMAPCRITGSGRIRLRREFTVSDLETFYRTATEWPSGSEPVRAKARARPKVSWKAKGGFLALAERRREAVGKAGRRKKDVRPTTGEQAFPASDAACLADGDRGTGRPPSEDGGSNRKQGDGHNDHDHRNR
jgi:hypothetical protein